MKNKIILVLLFIFPIVTYLIFASAKHNSLFLPVLSKNLKEIPSDWKSLDGEKTMLTNKITVLGFTGSSIDSIKGNLFNLNQKIYQKYFGFEDFQIVMVAPNGTQSEIQKIIVELNRITDDMKGWHFVFAEPSEIVKYHNSLHLVSNLDSGFGSPSVIIVDKERSHRGRKGKNKKGEQEYKESYNTVSAADLHNEMTDDVKIILREYRLALKKNKRKDSFRDNITKRVEEKQKAN